VFGSWPGLAPDRLAGPGDLAITTDFRSVLSEALPEDTSAIARRHIFPGFELREPLGLFRTGLSARSASAGAAESLRA
jgi:uncharacterized protein (DUF1501 family)